MKYHFATLILISTYMTSCASIDLSLTDSELLFLENKAVDSQLINEALEIVSNSKIDSMIISQGDEVLLKKYNNQFTIDKKHDLRSATKSITSLLIGIAIDQGFISDENQSLLFWFPEYFEISEKFSQITISHLLSMTSGLDSDDWEKSSPGNEEKMYLCKSWIDFFFKLDKITLPGNEFHYSTAGVVVLGEIIQRASKMPLEEFANQFLFSHLDITDWKYEYTRAGEVDSGGHLKLNAYDFHKIAFIYLNEGLYNQTRIVSSNWINKTLTPQVRIENRNGESNLYMGYLWWLEPVIEGVVKSYQARGNGGQYLIVFPEFCLIISFTGTAFNSYKQMLPFAIVKDYILPAFLKFKL